MERAGVEITAPDGRSCERVGPGGWVPDGVIPPRLDRDPIPERDMGYLGIPPPHLNEAAACHARGPIREAGSGRLGRCDGAVLLGEMAGG